MRARPRPVRTDLWVYHYLRAVLDLSRRPSRLRASSVAGRVGKDAPVDLNQRIAALRESCRTTPGVTSLVVFGSTTRAGAGRRDDWSDIDANIFLAPTAAEALRQTWEFLPDRDRLVLTAREGADGGVVLWDDGLLAEFGAGLPWEIRDPDHEVLLDGGDLRFTAPGPLPDAVDQVGLFLAKLLIGVGRYRRGERVAGHAHVRGYAVAHLAEALRQRLAPHAGRSPFDPLRRLELALPAQAARLDELLAADLEECARGLLGLARQQLEPHWPQFPSAAADLIAARLGWPAED